MIKSDNCFWLIVHGFHAVPYVITLTSLFSTGGKLFDGCQDVFNVGWLLSSLLYDEFSRKVNGTN